MAETIVYVLFSCSGLIIACAKLRILFIAYYSGLDPNPTNFERYQMIAEVALIGFVVIILGLGYIPRILQQFQDARL